MNQGDMNSETYIQAPFIQPREIPQTIRKKPSMFMRLLKKRSIIGEERTKYTVETGFYKLDDNIPDFSEAQSSVETRQGEDDGGDLGDDFRDYRDVYSNLTYLSTMDELTGGLAGPSSVPAAAPSLAPSLGPSLGPSLTQAQPPSEPSSPCPASAHVPVVYSWDPNQPMPVEDTRLEPIQAVVSEYSRTLNDAFFGQNEDDEDGQDVPFEEQLQRRGKFRRALRGLKRK